MISFSLRVTSKMSALFQPIIQSLVSLITPEYYWYMVMATTAIFPLLILTVFEVNYSPIALMFFVYLGFVQYFDVYDILSMVSLNTLYIIPVVILYCVTGTFISLLKWWIFVHRDTEKNKLVVYTGPEKEIYFRKYVSDHSVKIKRWILLWPMALINLFLGEIYRFMTTMIFENLYTKYVNIAMYTVDHRLTENNDSSHLLSPVFHDDNRVDDENSRPGQTL